MVGERRFSTSGKYKPFIYLPKKATGFADLRLTFSCQNIFTITGYKGMDPAGTTFSNNSVDVDAGIDMVPIRPREHSLSVSG